MQPLTGFSAKSVLSEALPTALTIVSNETTNEVPTDVGTNNILQIMHNAPSYLEPCDKPAAP